MKAILSLALTVLAVLPMSAQEGFSWGIELFPNISHRRITPLINDVTVQEIEVFENLEINRFSYSGGLMAYWRQEKVGFKTGLTFVESGYQTKRTEVDLREDAPPGADRKQVQHLNYFLEAPAEVLFYQQLNPRNEFLFSMGLALAVNLFNRERTTFFVGDVETQRSAEPEDLNFSRMGYSFLTSLGWEHHFRSGFDLALQPTFQFWLSGLLNEPNARINRSLYATGLRLSVKF